MYLLREGAGRIELVGGRINPENRNQPQRGHGPDENRLDGDESLANQLPETDDASGHPGQSQHQSRTKELGGLSPGQKRSSDSGRSQECQSGALPESDPPFYQSSWSPFRQPIKKGAAQQRGGRKGGEQIDGPLAGGQ